MPDITIPLHAIKGRGAITQPQHRFERDAREAFDDGWGTVGNLLSQEKINADDDKHETDRSDQDVDLPPLKTHITFEDAKSVIGSNDSPDIYFDYSINPYRGCEHGCVYCYARPTHSYLGLSPGLDFETRLIAKRNIAQVLRKELAKPSYTPQLLNIGSATDCYQPIERELKLTRQVIEVMNECHHPFSLVTKSSLVERDMDLIAPMAERKLAAVYVTITTLDSKLTRLLEPRAAAPQRRLRVIKSLTDMGIPVGVSVAPQIPFLNEDMEQVLEAAHDAGASTAFYTVLRLPWELNSVFQQWLQHHYPDRAARVMARIRDMRGGKDYDANFATRMKGSGLWAELIRERFNKTVQRLGMNRERREQDLTQFVRPNLHGQTSLFD
jgi:DNA repair photolyase